MATDSLHRCTSCNLFVCFRCCFFALPSAPEVAAMALLVKNGFDWGNIVGLVNQHPAASWASFEPRVVLEELYEMALTFNGSAGVALAEQ